MKTPTTRHRTAVGKGYRGEAGINRGLIKRGNVPGKLCEKWKHRTARNIMTNYMCHRQLLVIRRLLVVWYAVIIVGLPSSSAHAAKAISCVFKNALLDRGQDPSVAYEDGYYYLIQSNGGNLEIRKSATLTGLHTAQSITVFTPP